MPTGARGTTTPILGQFLAQFCQIALACSKPCFLVLYLSSYLSTCSYLSPKFYQNWIMLRRFSKIGPKIDQIWAWLSRRHPRSPKTPHKFGHGPYFVGKLLYRNPEIKFNKKISVNPPPPPLVPTSSPPRIINRNYFLNPLPKQELRFSHIIIILSQPTFELRPMPKYSSTLNVGIRRSLKFGLFLSLVSILNRSLEQWNII